MHCFQSLANSNTTTLNKALCTCCFLFVAEYFEEMDCWVQGKRTCCRVSRPHPSPGYTDLHPQRTREPVSALTLAEQLVKPDFYRSDVRNVSSGKCFHLLFLIMKKAGHPLKCLRAPYIFFSCRLSVSVSSCFLLTTTHSV